VVIFCIYDGSRGAEDENSSAVSLRSVQRTISDKL
jgi:hypothetical protein